MSEPEKSMPLHCGYRKLKSFQVPQTNRKKPPQTVLEQAKLLCVESADEIRSFSKRILLGGGFGQWPFTLDPILQ
jgi:hypothetical protein